jgi:hypothetical protein
MIDAAKDASILDIIASDSGLKLSVVAAIKSVEAKLAKK